MRKIETSHDLKIPGYGLIPAGTSFMVEKYNSRFVYVKIHDRVTLRLARKSDCIVKY